ncbi:hypothetical protein NEOLEDRAFT_1149255 [Neolentinus lepideus HHB14362 ss-1]|uniref:Protein prenylyltransferase n=1 Tax=Neolentinus lepideus HHB14362 ss-1 TaxID=1314782 RepID=A0A165RAC6_9AGAM|nr:hypothetical protein NEOLEDRAFT_1149255 [Neolentinus lepideus HHB14362 ss-1]
MILNTTHRRVSCYTCTNYSNLVYAGTKTLCMAQSSNVLYQLADVLTLPLNSIEVLPGDGKEWQPYFSSQGPFLLQDGNLGVPQKVLYQVYLVAVRQMTLLKPISRLDQTEASNFVRLTSVVLLANSAHQTALSHRKSLIQASVLNPERELEFVGALLTIREASKQSLLWYYRRWLLRCIHGDNPSSHNQSEDDLFRTPLSLGVIRKELTTVARACEIYPRNYYAWLHRHHCATVLVSSCRGIVEGHSKSRQVDAFVDALLEEFHWARQWLENHVADYSAADYLVKLATRVHTTIFDCRSSSTALSREADSLEAHALSLVQSYPDHETMWMYMRLVICSINSRSLYRNDIRSFAESIISSPSQATVNDERSAAWNAQRFLDWMDRETSRPLFP